jgi:type I restriction enzyme S subunit
MRDGWVEAKLGDVVNIINGGTPSTKEENYWGGEIVWITTTELTAFDGKKVDFSKRTITQDGLDSGPVRLVRAGTTLVGTTATIGTCAMAGCDLTFNQQISGLVPNTIDIDDDFLFYFIQYIKPILEGLSAGTSFKRISTNVLKSVSIIYPPIEEQKRIVDLLSSIDSYIEALQQQLESAKRSRNALVESQILELSDISLSSLKNLSTKIGSGATPRGGEEVYIETGVNLIRSQNVYDSNFVMRGLVAIEDSAAKALENVTVEKGDVLINITGASVTRCCVVDSTILPARVNQHVAIIRSDKAKILPKYLVLVLTSNEVKGFLNDIAGTGSTRQALTKSHLEDLEILVPSISKQNEIIENSDAFDTAISKSQIALDQAKILRSGLLNDLLSGEHEIPTTYDKVIGAA